MFSGIVQCVGEVTAIEALAGGGKRMRVVAPISASRLEVGASVAHSGACMTLTDIEIISQAQSLWHVDVSPESLALTTMDGWTAGTQVNLETSLRHGDQNGGHNVMGHVDGTAKVLSISQDGASWRLRLGVDKAHMPMLPHKGSVALDGISLTIVEPDLADGSFGVAIIPHTWTNTTLHTRQVGDSLNFEIDTFARYVARYVDQYMAAREQTQ